MKKITIELDEVVYEYLAHCARMTGQSIEMLAAGAIGNLVIGLEDQICKLFLEDKEI